jgi:Chitobiase/beta-hexosaminidase C-terminal domain
VKTVFLALLLIVTAARAQDAATLASQQATMAAQQVGLQAAQQGQDMMTASQQATLLAQQQINQMNQQALLQMQIAGVNTSRYALSIPAWNDLKVASWNHLDLSVKPGVVKPGTQVRIKWRGGDYAAVYYTLDGWSPTLASTRYTGPITINGPVHLQAVGIDWQWTRSETMDAYYDVTPNAQSSSNPTVVTDGLLRAGTMLKLKTVAEVRSDSAKPGDRVSLLLDQDVMIGDTVVIPKGTSVDAVVIQVTTPVGHHRPGLLVVAVRSLQDTRAPIQLLGSETMEGRSGQNAEQAIIEPGMTLYAKVAADTKLRP